LKATKISSILVDKAEDQKAREFFSFPFILGKNKKKSEEMVLALALHLLSPTRVNLAGVAVATLLRHFLGWFWYSAFADPWCRAVHKKSAIQFRAVGFRFLSLLITSPFIIFFLLSLFLFLLLLLFLPPSYYLLTWFLICF
jgi:hypothetical protein